MPTVWLRILSYKTLQTATTGQNTPVPNAFQTMQHLTPGSKAASREPFQPRDLAELLEDAGTWYPSHHAYRGKTQGLRRSLRSQSIWGKARQAHRPIRSSGILFYPKIRTDSDLPHYEATRFKTTCLFGPFRIAPPLPCHTPDRHA